MISYLYLTNQMHRFFRLTFQRFVTPTTSSKMIISTMSTCVFAATVTKKTDGPLIEDNKRLCRYRIERFDINNPSHYEQIKNYYQHMIVNMILLKILCCF